MYRRGIYEKNYADNFYNSLFLALDRSLPKLITVMVSMIQMQ